MTSVNYVNGAVEIRYPECTVVLDDIYSTRIELDRIKCYRTFCDEADFGYYTALADLLQDALNQMVHDREICQILNKGYLNAAHASC